MNNNLCKITLHTNNDFLILYELTLKQTLNKHIIHYFTLIIHYRLHSQILLPIST